MRTFTHEWWLTHQETEHWAYYNNVFTPDECQKIIDTFASQELEEGYIDGGKHNDRIRKSKLHFIDSSDPDTQWMYDPVSKAVLTLNNDFFGFDIEKIEVLQFSEYHSEYGGFYDKHIDQMMSGHGHRKLSFTIQLCDEESYEGGNLNLWLKNDPDVAPRTQGTMTLFPSYTLHEVEPVTKGSRYALVGWVWGPRFK